MLLANHQGSVVGVSNASGAMLYRNGYDAYGARGGADAGRFSFTGLFGGSDRTALPGYDPRFVIPELGLLHYKARAYNTTIGRFMQTLTFKPKMQMART